MSFDVNWDVDKYREDHECDEHWELRKAFIERWKQDYSEDRLICLARVFANVEFMGCSYPPVLMQEVARLSEEVAKDFRQSRKNMLKRTFVSASDAAEDRAKGTKREGGVIVETNATKSGRIQFVKPGQSIEIEPVKEETVVPSTSRLNEEIKAPPTQDDNEYIKGMATVQCLDPRDFNENMFLTRFGRFVLFVRPWASILANLQTSCQVCRLPISCLFENGVMSLLVNEIVVAQATGFNKNDAKSNVETLAWNVLRQEAITVHVKEVWIAQGSTITVDEVSGRRRRDDEFGTPVENSVATKMMKMMGWKGGGLGADAQGIAEPIKPHLQMVNRQGLGSASSNTNELWRSANALMRRYLISDSLDVDLVFSRDFSKEERATLHKIAQKLGLATRSYGTNEERFLVVKKKLDPFSLARAVIEKGGSTPKYQVFIPCGVINGVRN